MIGIVCLTKENRDKPWILFEAGALAKGLSSNRVCTFLVDLRPTDLESPLAQFNATLPKKQSVHALVRTLNSASGAPWLDDKTLEKTFETYWPQFESGFNEILANHPEETVVEVRSESSLLTEILATTRSLAQRLNNMETRIHKEALTLARELNAEALSNMANINSIRAQEALRSTINEDKPTGLKRKIIHSRNGLPLSNDEVLESDN